MSRNCIVCNEPIHPERLEALPNTIHCVRHSEATVPRGLMVYSHKTAPVLVVIPPSKEAMRQAQRANRRAR
jgi:hypothetical protein